MAESLWLEKAQQIPNPGAREGGGETKAERLFFLLKEKKAGRKEREREREREREVTYGRSTNNSMPP